MITLIFNQTINQSPNRNVPSLLRALGTYGHPLTQRVIIITKHTFYTEHFQLKLLIQISQVTSVTATRWPPISIVRRATPGAGLRD